MTHNYDCDNHLSLFTIEDIMKIKPVNFEPIINIGISTKKVKGEAFFRNLCPFFLEKRAIKQKKEKIFCNLYK